MEGKLNNIMEGKLQKRLMYELTTNANVNYIDIDIENNIVKFVYKNINIEFKLDKAYPFRPPISMFINDEPIMNCLQNTELNEKLTTLLFKKYATRCLYCESLVCNNNWRPTCTLVNVVEEFLDNKEKMSNLSNILLYKQLVSDKLYNIPDMVYSRIVQFI
jgi:ubiquitin-protein ligase